MFVLCVACNECFSFGSNRNGFLFLFKLDLPRRGQEKGLKKGNMERNTKLNLCRKIKKAKLLKRLLTED